MKLTTNNGKFLIFSEIMGIALYYENLEFKNEDGESQTRKKINRIVRNGKREWDWASQNWGQESQELSKDEVSLLNYASRKLRGVETVAIKNSKGSSAVLGQSNFFMAPQSGYLVSCGRGHTSRRVHQGGNSWDLFSFQKVGQIQDKVAGTACDFGTYDGCPKFFAGITEEELVPLTQREWEELSGVKFSITGEFDWFKSTIEDQPQLRGFHREGNYVLRVPFRSHSEMGELAVYPDQAQSDQWGWEKLVSGYENPLLVKKIEVKIPGCKNFVVAEDNTSDGIRKIYFANFQFFTFPAFWVGYEITTGGIREAIDGLKTKAVGQIVGQINYKLRRNGGVDEKKVLGYFKNQGIFIGTPADSLSVGNCATGTWEWMKKTFSGLPQNESVSWNHFPISIHKEFKISYEIMEKMFHQNYSFAKVAEGIFLRANPISGALTTETASHLLFESIEQSIGKIITRWEAKKLGVIFEDENLIRLQMKKINEKNSIPTTLGDIFGDLLSSLK